MLTMYLFTAAVVPIVCIFMVLALILHIGKRLNRNSSDIIRAEIRMLELLGQINDLHGTSFKVTKEAIFETHAVIEVMLEDSGRE